MATTAVGKQAEAAVADFLQANGYKILAQNWRTRWCELDLVVRKGSIIYFVEVKYRASETQGSGFDYIGPHKINQLNFAAKFWNSQAGWEGDYQIIGAEVTGINFEDVHLVEVS